ncbi:Protein RKD1 [Carex littledalei]|uniref:Protein RKD1 n=1 Tax=Carex littledalei TaxID=544730 RepID=A0A833RA47_9POAL|nr:Protein RKD1 [Carex littledalei]
MRTREGIGSQPHGKEMRGFSKKEREGCKLCFSSIDSDKSQTFTFSFDVVPCITQNQPFKIVPIITGTQLSGIYKDVPTGRNWVYRYVILQLSKAISIVVSFVQSPSSNIVSTQGFFVSAELVEYVMGIKWNILIEMEDIVYPPLIFIYLTGLNYLQATDISSVNFDPIMPEVLALRHRSRTKMVPIWKLNKCVMAIKHIRGLDGLGLLQAAGEFIKAEQDSNDANEQVGNVAVQRKIPYQLRKSGDLSIELVCPMFRKSQNEAAKELRVSQTTLKIWCRIKGIKRWPCRILIIMDGLAMNVEEYRMDSYLKVNGIHLTLSELEEKKRKFEEDPSTPIDDEIFLLRNYMCKRKSNKRCYVKHVQS